LPQSFVVAIFEFVLLLFSLSFHECAHAWMASRLGDQTARLEGRVTLNPMYHIDPFGTLLFPALIIFGPFIGFSMFSGFIVGWAKPTPVITRNFKKIRRDDNLTTLAGPLSNLILVAVAFLVLAVISFATPDGHRLVEFTFAAVVDRQILALNTSSWIVAVAILASLAILINLSLFFFNLFPIPPLDGSRLVRNLLPYNAMQVYDRIPMWISYMLMFLVGGFILSLFIFPALQLVFDALSAL